MRWHTRALREPVAAVIDIYCHGLAEPTMRAASWDSMKLRLSTLLECAAATGFAATTLIVAYSSGQPAAPSDQPVLMLGGASGPDDIGGDTLLSLMALPNNGFLWSLVMLVIGMAILHAVLRARVRFQAELEPSIWVGLALAAIWPWVIDSAPLGGWVLGAASAALMVRGLLVESHPRQDDLRLAPLGVVVAWNAMAFLGSSALLLQLLTGISAQEATLANLLATSVGGARIQLALGPNIAFSLTLIWAMIGIAAAVLTTSMTVSTACVLGIAALAVVIVRATT